MEKINIELSAREMQILRISVKTYVHSIGEFVQYNHPVYRELSSLNRMLDTVKAFGNVSRLEYDLLRAVQNMTIAMSEATAGMIVTDGKSVAEVVPDESGLKPMYIRDWERTDQGNDLLQRVDRIIYSEVTA